MYFASISEWLFSLSDLGDHDQERDQGLEHDQGDLIRGQRDQDQGQKGQDQRQKGPGQNLKLGLFVLLVLLHQVYFTLNEIVRYGAFHDCLKKKPQNFQINSQMFCQCRCFKS